MMNVIRVDTETGKIAIDTEIWAAKSRVVITCGVDGVRIQYGEEGSEKFPVATSSSDSATGTVKSLVERFFQFSPT
jgi:hypothetical protein